MDDTGEGDVRVSDAERQAVVDRLSGACGDGLLTLEEFADHAGVAYAAVTRSQLDAATRELRLPVPVPGTALAPPVPGTALAAPSGWAPESAPAPAVPRPKRRWVVAVLGGEDRRGKWRVGARTGAVAFMGGIDIDLRDAFLEADVIEITAWAVMGGVNVIVPEGIAVECSGFMLMGGRSNRIADVPPLPGAPIIRVRGFGMWGGIDVCSKPARGAAAGAAAGDDARDDARDRRHQDRPQLPVLPPIPVAIPSLAPLPPPPMAAPVVPQGFPLVGGPPLAAPAGAAPLVTGLLTIVCTDIVGSTRYADTLGDQRWREVLLAHNALVREHALHHGATEVKNSGDGFLFAFASTRSAVQFAVDLQDAMVEHRLAHPETPLELRIGVHAGEVERDGTDLVGRNVALACRLCDVASPGTVLVSAVVADLADSASDLAFGPAVEHRLAGIERPVLARPANRR